MADEEVAAAVSPVPSDHKRKLEDLEPEAPEPQAADSNGDSESPEVSPNGVASEDPDAKRPRLDDKPDALESTENGYEEEKTDDEPKEEAEEKSVFENYTTESDNAEQRVDEPPEAVKEEQEGPTVDVDASGSVEETSDDNAQLGNSNKNEESFKEELQETHDELQEPLSNVSQQVDPSGQQQSDQLTSRKMEVPSNKVGVLIGKAGDTIRTLQYNSGARIQITRDADADPHSATRPVELIGSLESINKAEKLIKDVIAEADAGGSPSLVARGFSTVQSSGAGEQIQIQVPNEKVGLIIGKGGETIKNLQTRSGARIQLIPQHLPEGDQSKERTVRVTGDKKQIEMAREMIKEAMSQPIRSSNPSSGYNQQAFRPRGPGPQWGHRSSHPSPAGYDYQHRGPYPSQSQQYPSPAYGNYPPQQGPPRSNFGWEQRPPATLQGPHDQTGYDYYGGQGGHSATPSIPIHPHPPGPVMGPPPSQTGYNYGQSQGPDYGQPTPYSQTAPQPNYGHGYEPKYENQPQHPYGGHGSQPSTYPQGANQPGYGQQDQYGKPPSYNMPQQGPYAQPYGQPRASQPADVPYQGPAPSAQSYGPNAAAQQPYPYAASGPMQQTYPSYGSVPASDGYNHPASAPGYPQQGGQPVSGYAQTGGQQAPNYAQVGPTAAYGQYPSSQPGFTEQAAPNSAGYGYQGVADPAYGAGPGSAYGAPPTGQSAYSQPAQTQPAYDQSAPPQSGGYGNVPVGYGKSVSPQPGYPQYDASQMYGAHR